MEDRQQGDRVRVTARGRGQHSRPLMAGWHFLVTAYGNLEGISHGLVSSWWGQHGSESYDVSGAHGHVS